MNKKFYESPHSEWEVMTVTEVLCGSLDNVSNEDYTDGGNYEW